MMVFIAYMWKNGNTATVTSCGACGSVVLSIVTPVNVEMTMKCTS